MRRHADSEPATSAEPSHYYGQVDLLKGMAILSVIVMHSVDELWLRRVGYGFYILQAVPVFLVLMGMASARTFVREDGSSLSTRRDYFKRKAWRLVAPWLELFVVTASLRAILSIATHRLRLGIGWQTLLFVLPVSGPGNYFVAVAIQWVLVAPFVWAWYRRHPGVMMSLLFLATFITIVGVWLAPGGAAGPLGDTIHHTALPFLFALGLGVWISSDWSFASPRNRWIYAFATLGVVQIALTTFLGKSSLPVLGGPGAENPFTFSWAAVLVMLGMTHLPSRAVRRAWEPLAVIGKASYHIFLLQIVWFGTGAPSRFVGAVSPWLPGSLAVVCVLLSSLAVCLPLGVAWFRLEGGRRHSPLKSQPAQADV